VQDQERNLSDLPDQRRSHQCDLFVVSHIFVFYRVADMRSNPESDETFFD
jgi:hypothetical protein